MKRKEFQDLVSQNAERISQESGSLPGHSLVAYVTAGSELFVGQRQAGWWVDGATKEMFFGTHRLTPMQVRLWCSDYYEEDFDGI